jgi:hypothetical protein
VLSNSISRRRDATAATNSEANAAALSSPRATESFSSRFDRHPVRVGWPTLSSWRIGIITNRRHLFRVSACVCRAETLAGGGKRCVGRPARRVRYRGSETQPDECDLPAGYFKWSESAMPGGRKKAERSMPLRIEEFMDRQTKHEIWLLAIGTIMVEVPVAAIAVLAILAR